MDASPTLSIENRINSLEDTDTVAILERDVRQLPSIASDLPRDPPALLALMDASPPLSVEDRLNNLEDTVAILKRDVHAINNRALVALRRVRMRTASSSVDRQRHQRPVSVDSVESVTNIL